MGKIYTESGWVNWDYLLSQPESFLAVVGARGTGKTYGLLKKLVLEDKPFIYLRRLKSQLDQCGRDEGNPFKKINADAGTDIKPFPTQGFISFRRGEKTGSLMAVGVALSVVANTRGTDFSDIDYVDPETGAIVHITPNVSIVESTYKMTFTRDYTKLLENIKLYGQYKKEFE